VYHTTSILNVKVTISKYGAYTATYEYTKVLSTHFYQNCHSFFNIATFKIQMERTFEDDSNRKLYAPGKIHATQ